MTHKEESDFERILGGDYQKANYSPPVQPEPSDYCGNADLRTASLDPIWTTVYQPALLTRTYATLQAWRTPR
jgi:hypothetical protein